MFKYVSKSFLLLVFAVGICCIVYPLALLGAGQLWFPNQANGSLIRGADGKVIGSRLIAQPFTKDGYFWPRPSAASYNGAASSSSSLAASNYALRNRVAQSLAPLATYKGGPMAGKSAAPDIEAWFCRDSFQGKPGLVAQWASLHNSQAKSWLGADPSHAAYVDAWAARNPAIVADFIRDNPATPKPQASDLLSLFFADFSRNNPGRFPSSVTLTDAKGVSTTSVRPVDSGSDIQTQFFDMWLTDNPGVKLQEIPADYVTTSASGLDPDITMDNALYQLDRVAEARAAQLSGDSTALRSEIKTILDRKAVSPLGGLAGERLVNVLVLNLELDKKFGQFK